MFKLLLHATGIFGVHNKKLIQYRQDKVGYYL